MALQKVVLTKRLKTMAKSTNTQSHDFIGLVMGYNEEKYVDLEQRNNFKVGDKVNSANLKETL